jgi:integrase
MARRRTRGTGEVYREEGRLWAFRWREGGKRRYSGGHATKAIAEQALAQVRARIGLDRAGLPFDPQAVPRLHALAKEFLERRKATHAAAKEDEYRWKRHLDPDFGRLRPHEVDTAKIRAWIERKRAELAPGTIRVALALLSSLYIDLQERKLAAANPARGLPPSVMRLVRSDHDPRTVPFIERLEDVRRIFLKLPKPFNVAFAIGAVAGLRTGEVFALRWGHVDLAARRIHVRESVKGPLKDKDSRIVPIQGALLPILTAWRLETGGHGLVVPPLRSDGKTINIHATPGARLRTAMKALGLARPGFGLPLEGERPQKLWYWCTRHTFASQWVMGGGSIEKLSTIMGHYSITVTERYAHLRPELFTAKDHDMLRVDLEPGSQEALPFPGPAEGQAGPGNGQPSASKKDHRSRKRRS